MASPAPKPRRSAFSRIVRDNGLSFVLVVIFLGSIAGQAMVGWNDANEENRLHHQPEVSLGDYLGSGDFGEAVFENWESEFLQMAVYVVLTAFLFQRGSAESKDPDGAEIEPDQKPGSGSAPLWARAGGWRCLIYSHSLSLTLGCLFLLSFLGHAFFGMRAFNEEAAEHGLPAISLWSYLGSSRFWFESLQNWQSEFLAILTLVVLSIRLREANSPESKPVFSSHASTGK